MAEGDRDVGQLTVKEILSRLKPGQAWAVGVALCALVGGAFGLGHALSSMAAEGKIGRLEGQVESLELRIHRARGLEAKERFLALYLRYLLAKERAAGNGSDENGVTLIVAKDALEEAILEMWKRHKEAPGGDEVRGLTIGKGAEPGKATVKFAYDGSVWPIPPEFRVAAAKQ